MLDKYCARYGVRSNFIDISDILKNYLICLFNLGFRLNCSFIYLLQGWFTPGQIFVLDEYCARYGVRSCYRHLRYLEDLLDRSEKNILVDPTLIHFSYAYCASHVHGNR